MDDPSWWRLNKGAPTADDTGMRNTYNGFTVKELASLGAFPDGFHSKTSLHNLQNIHPIFSQDNWEEDIPAQFAGKRKLCPLGKDPKNKLHEGNWTAHNPVVWKVLEPSLKLASKFVENAHIFPWYDALIHGVKKTGQSQLSKRRFFNFYYRPKQYLNTPGSQKSIREFMARIAQNISFGISDGDFDPRTGEKYPEGKQRYNVTLPPWEDAEDFSRIWLAYQAILPLMQDDVLGKARLTYQVDIALILLREFAHIVTYSVRQTLRQRPDLRCEDDLGFEPGLSFETFGGRFRSIRNGQSGLVPPCSILEGWAGIKKSPERHLLVAPEVTATDGSTTCQYRSIPFCYLEDLFQEEFWKFFVKKWGAEALRIYPVTEGRVVQRENGKLEDWKLLTIPNEGTLWVTDAKKIDKRGLKALKVEDRIAFKIAKWRIQQANKIAETVKADKRKSDLRNAQEESPQSIQEQRLQVQRKMLITHKFRCRIRAEEAYRFLRSNDVDTEEYKKSREDLIERNKGDRELAMAWKEVAEDEDLAEEYQKIFDRYEKIKAIIAPEYNQKLHSPSQDRTAEEWEALLGKAHGFLERYDISEAVKICKEITEDVDAPNGIVAEAYLLLAIEDIQDRMRYAQQAIKMFELLRWGSGNEVDQHINDKLIAAKAHLQTAKIEMKPKGLKKFPSAKVQPSSFKTAAQSVSSKLKAKDPPNTQVAGQERASAKSTNSSKTQRKEKEISSHTKPASLPVVQPEAAQEIEAAAESNEAEETEAPATPRNYGWRPEVRPGMEDVTPQTRQEESQMELYDEAYTARRKGDQSTSERIFLSLLQMKNLNAYTKALCHVQLATMAHRTDQTEHARRAQLIFMQLELARPDSHRAATDRQSADRLMRAVERSEREKKENAPWSLVQGLWSLLGRKRKIEDGEDGAVREVAGAIVDPSNGDSPPKRARFL